MTDFTRIAPERFSGLLSSLRRRWWRERADQAAWAAAGQPHGGTVLQLRARGKVAEVRANILLAALILTILAGLAYYIGLPFLREFVDGRRQTLQQTIAAAKSDAHALDARRETAWTDLVEALRPGLIRVDLPASVGPEVWFTGHAELGDGTLLLYGSERTVLWLEGDGPATPVGLPSSVGPEVWFNGHVDLGDGALLL